MPLLHRVLLTLLLLLPKRHRRLQTLPVHRPLRLLRMLLRLRTLQTLLFLPLLLNIGLQESRIATTILPFLGQHSTNMWFTHNFFCFHFFGSYIYGLRYPLLIFLALIAVSVACSYVINIIYNPIKKRIRKT